MAGSDVVAILTRAPSSGGKARLFSALGISPDPGLLTALLLDTLDNASIGGAATVLAVTPASACRELRVIAPGVEVIAQPEGTLGDRMEGTMATLIARGAARVALVGSDLPSITPAHVRAAFSALDADPDAVVLGPAVDGGYYLVASAVVPAIFSACEWGTPHVLEQTLSAATAAGVAVHLLEPLEDVDTLDDLRLAASRPGAVRTREWWNSRSA
ncbi:MAG: TIGR04282 family arsenosugar biosynthesis glycosyltransferase [Vicinamibacterales bacterium]